MTPSEYFEAVAAEAFSHLSLVDTGLDDDEHDPLPQPLTEYEHVLLWRGIEAGAAAALDVLREAGLIQPQHDD